ncbi:hypothetical protein GW937_00170 [Candidatus Kaiserbacteria bacterium]|nr:hypothetical protein [Candidatus Kaiserbacteria bacterium]NCT01756.1 hypothetical protein [Candidatus Parcubacteria bacterium]
MFEKFKSLLADDTIFMAILLVLVAVVSFGLGRQSATTPVPILPNDTANQLELGSGVILTQVPLQTAVVPSTSPETVTSIVASRSGTKYHLLSCPGAVQIKEENKIYFTSIEAAKAAGYLPASNCPDLQ